MNPAIGTIALIGILPVLKEIGSKSLKGVEVKNMTNTKYVAFITPSDAGDVKREFNQFLSKQMVDDIKSGLMSRIQPLTSDLDFKDIQFDVVAEFDMDLDESTLVYFKFESICLPQPSVRKGYQYQETLNKLLPIIEGYCKEVMPRIVDQVLGEGQYNEYDFHDFESSNYIQEVVVFDGEDPTIAPLNQMVLI